MKAAANANAEVVSYPLDDYAGPKGEPLVLDVASIGNPDAQNVVVIGSGIHGVELPLGSSLQCEWFLAAKDICATRDDIRFVFVHALNPYGAAYGLRTDRDNIDPNRNFVDFSRPQSTSPNYRALADAFAPKTLDRLALAKAWAKMLKFALVTHSIGAFKQALVDGQYEFPDGLYYGGTAPSWTRKTWEEIVCTHISNEKLKNLWHVNIHTGEGPYGKLQLMVNTTKDSPLYKRVSRLGQPEIIRITKSFGALTGDIQDYWSPDLCKDLGNVVVTPVTIEVGTSKMLSAIEGLDVLYAMIARNTLKQRYADRHRDAPKIIQKMRDIAKLK